MMRCWNDPGTSPGLKVHQHDKVRNHCKRVFFASSAISQFKGDRHGNKKNIASRWQINMGGVSRRVSLPLRNEKKPLQFAGACINLLLSNMRSFPHILFWNYWARVTVTILSAGSHSTVAPRPSAMTRKGTIVLLFLI